MTRPINFYAGPAIHPQPVLEEAARGVVALDGVGLSILEISHRSPAFDAIIEDTRDRIRRLLDVPDTHDILFLQGGARGQFAMVPLNFLPPGARAAYVVSGAWGEGAFAEARRMGDAFALASGEASHYSVLPDIGADERAATAGCAYVHTTSNNTIYGTQLHAFPDLGEARHVCDMSSDILSRPLDVSSFGLIYAGAQKNMGPAGVTMVILDKAWMAEGREDIPAIWRYAVHGKKGSMYQTPPTFGIWVMGLVAKWVEDQGGVAAIAARNEAKAKKLYGAMDASSGFYRPAVPNPAHRSYMNVAWRLADAELEPAFVAEAAAEGLIGLKGHRKVGGIRASLYNAMDLAGVERLVDFMGRFAAKNG